ncbi:MAG: outer membrane protein [Alphaproteobacteria bacterium]
MPKIAMKAALVATTLLTSSAAIAAEPNWYASGAGGATWFEQADGQANGNSLETSFDTGYVFLGAGGYRFGNGFRAEGELGYRRSSADTTQVNSGPEFNTEGSMSALSFMANGYYDFDVGMKIKPYIGGGIGVARVSANDLRFNGSQLADDSDAVFAYQAIGGLGYDLTQNLTAFVEYRYFATLDPTFNATSGGDYESQFMSHNALLGVRYNF